jgi:hypothetical protein
LTHATVPRSELADRRVPRGGLLDVLGADAADHAGEGHVADVDRCPQRDSASASARAIWAMVRVGCRVRWRQVTGMTWIPRPAR